MNRFRRLALGIVPALVLFTAPMVWNASAESGVFGDSCEWTIEDDVLTITAQDGSFEMTLQDGVMLISGTTFRDFTGGMDETDDEALRPVFDFAENFTVEKIVIDVDELFESIAFLKYAGEIDIELTARVSFVADQALCNIPAYSVVTVYSPELSLDGSGLGYTADGEAMVIGIRGHVGSPAEEYAAQEAAFEFFPMEAGGQYDAAGQYSWEIKDDVLVISADDGSYQMECLPGEALVTGTSFTGLPQFAWLDDNMPLIMFMLDYAPDRMVFDVEQIDSAQADIDTEGMVLVLTDKVQKICEDGLYWVAPDTQVHVESQYLELEGSGLGLDGAVTIYGYQNSPAQAYAETYDLSFVAFDEPEETTSFATETSTEEPEDGTSTSASSETSESTSASSSSSSESSGSSSSTSTESTSTSTETNSGYEIMLLSMPDTGDRILPLLSAAGITALLGGMLCRKKK